MGGEIVRMFALDHPDEVAGIVLVDGGHEDDTVNLMGKMTTLRAMSKGRPIPEPRPSVTAADGLDAAAVQQIEAMVKKFDMTPKIEAPYDKLPEAVRHLQLWSAGQPKHWAATDDALGPEESQRLYERDHVSEHPLGSIPLIVLTQDMAGRSDAHAQAHLQTQKEMAGYSTQGKQIVVAGAGHHIQLEKPDVVVAAVRALLDHARAASALR
jgi:pimeloyl-ACP methyl ester carboxylesterase